MSRRLGSVSRSGFGLAAAATVLVACVAENVPTAPGGAAGVLAPGGTAGALNTELLPGLGALEC